jgi:hypothetical protein
MTKTFILRIAEQNYFSIKVEAETSNKAKEIVEDVGFGEFKSFKEVCDWDVINCEEES